VVLPCFGAGVPPVGAVVVDRVDSVVVVDRFCVEAEGIVIVVVELELSPAAMITPTPSPTTKASRMPMIQRVRLSTGAMLVEDPAEDLESLVNLGLADHEWRQEPQGVGADRVDDQAFGQQP
jgi:hypothetical protein